MLSLSLFCDEISALPTQTVRTLKRPGLVFRVPDYPTLVIRPAGGLRREGEDDSHTLNFDMGKSCLIEWGGTPPDTLNLLLLFVDLVEEPSSARPTAGSKAHGKTSEAGKGLLIGGAMCTVSVGRGGDDFQELNLQLRDLVGNPVAALHVR